MPVPPWLNLAMELLSTSRLGTFSCCYWLSYSVRRVPSGGFYSHVQLCRSSKMWLVMEFGKAKPTSLDRVSWIAVTFLEAYGIGSLLLKCHGTNQINGTNLDHVFQACTYITKHGYCIQIVRQPLANKQKCQKPWFQVGLLAMILCQVFFFCFIFESKHIASAINLKTGMPSIWKIEGQTGYSKHD